MNNSALSYPATLQKLIQQLSKLPSVGERSAGRLAYFLACKDKNTAANLAQALVDVVRSVRTCEECSFIADAELCSICASGNRDAAVLCVVEKPTDVLAIERSGEYRGVYHVLHGLWSPLRGVKAEDLGITKLIERVQRLGVQEVILATSSTVEGDATAVYISRLLNEIGVSSSRPAQGIPKGGELEYADEITLARALAARTQVR